MAIRLGNTFVRRVQLGNTQINLVYLGDVEVFPGGDPPAADWGPVDWNDLTGSGKFEFSQEGNDQVAPESRTLHVAYSTGAPPSGFGRRINQGSLDSVPHNSTFAVSNGDDIRFSIDAGNTSYTGTVTVRLDNSSGTIVDTFLVDYTIGGGP